MALLQLPYEQALSDTGECTHVSLSGAGAEGRLASCQGGVLMYEASCSGQGGVVLKCYVTNN